MFLAIPIVYWLTWAFFIVNDMLEIGIFYATCAALLTMFVLSKLETGKWTWAIKALFGKED
jgi:hypothetical protein